MREVRDNPRPLDYDAAPLHVPVGAWQKASEYFRIALKLLATFCVLVAILFGSVCMLTRPPAQLRESNLLGKSIQQIEQELGPAHYDSRSKDTTAGSPVFLTYTYRWGGICKIEFNERSIAISVVHFRK